jgi:hypothetical protein
MFVKGGKLKAVCLELRANMECEMEDDTCSRIQSGEWLLGPGGQEDPYNTLRNSDGPVQDMSESVVELDESQVEEIEDLCSAARPSPEEKSGSRGR